MIIIPLTDDHLIGQPGEYVIQKFSEFDRLINVPPGNLTDSQLQLFTLCAAQMVKNSGETHPEIIRGRQLRYLELCQELVRRLLLRY